MSFPIVLLYILPLFYVYYVSGSDEVAMATFYLQIVLSMSCSEQQQPISSLTSDAKRKNNRNLCV